MYGEQDFAAARRALRNSALAFGAVLLALLAGYAAALIAGAYRPCVLLALGMMVWMLAAGEMCLLPRKRYHRFLQEMQKGLRRETQCEILGMDAKVQLQDGVHVHAVQVRLEDGDSRIFYLNASKAEFLPEPGTRCRLVSYGRHVLEFSGN